jgi:hypothetical protein
MQPSRIQTFDVSRLFGLHSPPCYWLPYTVDGKFELFPGSHGNLRFPCQASFQEKLLCGNGSGTQPNSESLEREFRLYDISAYFARRIV